MAIAPSIHAAPIHVAQDHDRWIIAGYAVLAAIALVAIYFAAGGPGNSEPSLAFLMAMP